MAFYLESQPEDEQNLAPEDQAEGEDDGETKAEGRSEDDHVVERPD